MESFSEVNRELGEVKTGLNAVKEQASADAELMRIDIRERHGELRADIQRLTELHNAHAAARSRVSDETNARVSKLEADNNRSKGVVGVLMFFAAMLASLVTMFVGKAYAHADFIKAMFKQGGS